MDILILLSLVATFLFAISASINAIRKQFDLFGITIISIISGSGGGIVRDVLLGIYPITCVRDSKYFITILVAVTITILFKIKKIKLVKSFLFLDSLGLGSATIIGIQKALNAGIKPSMSILFGVISACFGSVIRDVLCNEVPLLFKKELYATVSLFGGIIFLIFISVGFDTVISSIISVIIISSSRLLSIKLKIALPPVKYK